MPSIFLCHASEDKAIVEPIQLALASAGCEVFYDEQSLPPGGDYQARIRAAVNNCDLFVFIASSASIVAGKFTLTELKFARERWPSPINRVLPVAIDGLEPRDLPNYLQAATVLTVSGSAAAEVRDAVESMLRELRRVAFDEKLVGSPEERVQGLVPVLLSSGAIVLIFCAIVWGSFHLTRWLFNPTGHDKGCFAPLAYVVFLIWYIGRFLKRMFASDEEPQLGILVCIGGALLGAVWSFIQLFRGAM